MAKSYIVTRINIRDETTILQVSDENSDTKFKILTVDYLQHTYAENQEIDREEYERLTDLHSYCYGWLQCLRKLSRKDYTVSEIRKYLQSLKTLKKKDCDRIVEQLSDLGFLDDEALASYQIEYLQNRLYGQRKIVNELRKRGLAEEILQNHLAEYDWQTEKEKGLQKARMLQKTIVNRSRRETEALLREKLKASGYLSSTVNEIMKETELPVDRESELKSLQTALAKAQRQYSRRYEGRKLSYQIFKYLRQKGFEAEDIKAQLAIKEEDSYED